MNSINFLIQNRKNSSDSTNCQTISCDLMTRISVGKMATWIFHFFKFNTNLSPNICFHLLPVVQHGPLVSMHMEERGIVAYRFVLNLKSWYSIVSHEVRRNCLAPWSASYTEYYPWFSEINISYLCIILCTNLPAGMCLFLIYACTYLPKEDT